MDVTRPRDFIDGVGSGFLAQPTDSQLCLQILVLMRVCVFSFVEGRNGDMETGDMAR